MTPLLTLMQKFYQHLAAHESVAYALTCSNGGKTRPAAEIWSGSNSVLLGWLHAWEGAGSDNITRSRRRSL